MSAPRPMRPPLSAGLTAESAIAAIYFRAGAGELVAIAIGIRRPATQSGKPGS
jgi:hypothetical protein